MIALINEIIEAVGKVLLALLNLLPDSPFNYVLNIDNQIMKFFCWIFPVPQVVSHMQAYVTAVAVYYCIRIALKWIKAAGA